MHNVQNFQCVWLFVEIGHSPEKDPPSGATASHHGNAEIETYHLNSTTNSRCYQGQHKLFIEDFRKN